MIYWTTVKVAELLVTFPAVAVMLVLPAATAWAKPLVLMVAAAVLLEVQVALLVMSWVVLSANVAVAVYCCVVAPPMPVTDICAAVGVMEIDFMAELVTVTVAVPLTVPEVAVMVAVPALTPVTKPLVFTVAKPAADVLHVRLGRWLVVLPSVFTPLAVNCTVCPFTTEGLGGVMVML